MFIDSNHTSATVSYYQDAKNALMGDYATQIAAMMIDHAKQSREQNQELRRGEEAHLRLVQREHIEALRTEADMIQAAANAQGNAMIASGFFTVGASVTTYFDSPNAAGIMNGSGKAAEGMGMLGKGENDRKAGLARAEATEYEHQSQEALRRLEDLDGDDESAKDLQRKAFEHLRVVQQIKADTDRALTSWRG